MATPRRLIVRPAPTPTPDPDRQRQLQKLRARLDLERTTFTRWMPRLKRAFHSVEKSQLRIARLERRIARLEDNTP
jgi:hypothetical protein